MSDNFAVLDYRQTPLGDNSSYEDFIQGIRPESASDGTLQPLGFKTWHRIFPNDYAEGPAAADWLGKHAQKVFVINDLSAYGAGVAGAVAKQLKKDGVQVITQGVDAKTTDFAAFVGKLKAGASLADIAKADGLKPETAHNVASMAHCWLFCDVRMVRDEPHTCQRRRTSGEIGTINCERHRRESVTT